jgi:hypothetical protein
MTASKLQSHQSNLAGVLQDEIAVVLKEEINQTLEKGLSTGVAAKFEDPEFLPQMQTYVLYVLFVLYFGTEAGFAHADRLVVGIVRLLQKSEIFYHQGLHEQSTDGSVARITQESWKRVVHPNFGALRTNTDII